DVGHPLRAPSQSRGARTGGAMGGRDTMGMGPPRCAARRTRGGAMFQRIATAWLRWLGGAPAFQVYGKARRERDWRVVDVFATHRRDLDSRWPAYLWRGTSIAWTS